MENIKLVTVSREYKDSVMAYKQEFMENKESMDGTANLRTCDTFEEWEAMLIDNSKEETVREGLVPATTLLAVRVSDNNLIGMVDIRHRLNDFLSNYGGHIGYSVRKTERRKRYATQILNQALKVCKDLEIKKVLLTCNKTNVASAKTILNNGGFLENEAQYDETTIIQRYWITL
ncbi:GNAT family N-acetyltransferase [Acidaminobacter sp. JC074]|uniref:GNAT family N-acetyltransferase n=1 Tax=Acidaminobacter sp. JC074 TaxID=2530199 RepID=UPI001F0E122E|nr:GNAT family N-acetyltransferase [Acidaminobacter sp. JC074]MCH4886288.1 GNAT family N-acetyltransferase [Acidaminobacter sp. JC074]